MKTTTADAFVAVHTALMTAERDLEALADPGPAGRDVAGAVGHVRSGRLLVARAHAAAVAAETPGTGP